MHIPDNYLSPQTCAVMFLAAAPVLVYSIKKIKIRLKEKKELAPMLGVAASLSFLMMILLFSKKSFLKRPHFNF